MKLESVPMVVIQQRKELAEIFGFETRNKYEIFDSQKNLIGFCAEQQKGFLGVLFRQLLGHWRSFEVHFFDSNRNLVMVAKHPFKFFFQEFHVFNASGKKIGWADQRFGILTKKFDVYSSQEEPAFKMRSGLFKIWTFPLTDRRGVETAVIKKRWGGVVKELFLDADNFAVEFKDTTLTQELRMLFLALGVFTDLQYFEKKGGGGINFDF